MEQIVEDAAPEIREAQSKVTEIPKFTMVTRSRALMDTQEDEFSDEESSRDNLDDNMMVKEILEGDPYSFNEAS
jgi:hypothetical protein